MDLLYSILGRKKTITRRHILISEMLIHGEIYNMELKSGMSKTKWVFLDTENSWWPQSAKPIHLPGNHDTSWVLGSMFSVPDFPGLLNQSGSWRQPRRPPLRSLCLLRLDSRVAALSVPTPSSRRTRIQPCCRCWPPFCFSLSGFSAWQASVPTLCEFPKVPSACSFTLQFPPFSTLHPVW